MLKFIDSDNIATDLNVERIDEISKECLKGFEEDCNSMEDWLADVDAAMDLTDIKREQKNFPFRGAANVKYPLTSLAVIQFASRAMPEMIRNGALAKTKIIGFDPSGTKDRRAVRTSKYSNYVLFEKIPNYMEERDRLLGQLAVVGVSFTKTWYDPAREELLSELIPYNLIKINDNTTSLEKAPRISHILYLTKNDVVENIRSGLYKEIPLETFDDTEDSEDPDHFEFIEQHTYLDLDGDDYCEPYIVTIHKRTTKVVRIVARYTADAIKVKKGRVVCIKPTHYFTDYHFIPNPRGTFHSIGFGTLLLDMNSMTNSLCNQMLNSGTLSMTQGGLYSNEVRIRKDMKDVEPGEWIPAENSSQALMKDNFMPFEYAPPSPVLFQLLEVLLGAGKELTSSTEALTGNADTVNASPTSILSNVEQGLKTFNAIRSRIVHSLGKELKKIFAIFAQRVDVREYVAVIDPGPQDLQEMFDESGKFIDFDMSNMDIVPVADANVASKAEELAKANAALQMGIQMMSVAPGAINPKALMARLFKAMEIENYEELIPPDSPQAPDPALELAKVDLQSQIDVRSKEMEHKEKELQIKAAEVEAKIAESRTKSVKNIADAEAQEAGVQISAYEAQMKGLTDTASIHAEDSKSKMDQQKMEQDQAPYSRDDLINEVNRRNAEGRKAAEDEASKRGLI